MTQQIMMSTWNIMPLDFHNEAMIRFLVTLCTHKTPSTMMLVKGTGNGKFPVPQIIITVTCDTNLVVNNSMLLLVDQCSKIKNTNPGHSRIKSIHLDFILNNHTQ